jgi:adenylosuccinate synthase
VTYASRKRRRALRFDPLYNRSTLKLKLRNLSRQKEVEKQSLADLEARRDQHPSIRIQIDEVNRKIRALDRRIERINRLLYFLGPIRFEPSYELRPGKKDAKPLVRWT